MGPPRSIGTTSAHPNTCKTGDPLSLDLFSFFGQVLDCFSGILLPVCELHLPGQRSGDDAQQLGVQQRCWFGGPYFGMLPILLGQRSDDDAQQLGVQQRCWFGDPYFGILPSHLCVPLFRVGRVSSLDDFEVASCWTELSGHNAKHHNISCSPSPSVILKRRNTYWFCFFAFNDCSLLF